MNPTASTDEGLGGPGSELKIINGYLTSVKYYPWQVAIGFADHNKKFFFACGGTQVNDHWIVTAAHCIHKGKKPEDYLIVSNRSRIDMLHPDHMTTATRVVVYEQTTSFVTDYDLALIKTKDKLQGKPAQLPAQGQSYQKDPRVVVTGFGKTKAGGRVPWSCSGSMDL